MQAADAADDRAEHDWRDHHLHELDEAVPKRLERCAKIRPDMTNRDAKNDAEKHLDVE